MDFSISFARHFARLVSLILRAPGEIEEQKAELRALVVVCRSGAVRLVADSGLTANDAPVPLLPGVDDLIAQIKAHGLSGLMVDIDAPPADLLGAARMLAGAPGAPAEAKRLELGANTLHFVEAVPESPESGGLSEFDFLEVFDDPIAEAKSRETPRFVPAITPPGEKQGERRSGLFAQFAAARVPTEPYDRLLDKLEDATDGDLISDLLDDLAVLTEQAAREGKSNVVADILFRIGRREAQLEGFETRRVFSLTLKRLAKPGILRLVAMQLPHQPDRRDDLVHVLVRAGDDGADVLVEQLAAVSHSSDRRVYFDVLRELKAGVPTLVHMLTDSRWFVARTAAELLGEMQVPQAELPLTEMLKHDDERARRAASGALMRLGTPRAMHAIDGALKDTTAQTRIDAAAAIATRKDLRTAATLIRALEAEKDDEVRAAFLLSLGKLKTPDAVQRLLQAAEAERGLFKKKSVAFRVAAIQGLGEARTPEALKALATLKSDKEADVRDAATYALGRIARTSGGGPSAATR